MNLIPYLLLIWLFPFNTFSQNKGRTGSITLKDGTVKKGYILYKNWSTSPSTIKFSEKSTDTFVVHDKTTISAFSISDEEIAESYKLFKVNIDTSDQTLEKLGNKRLPDEAEKEIFLKLLAGGRLNLYEATLHSSRTQFFYSFKNQVPVELLYKKYIIETTVSANNSYRNTLFNIMQDCSSAVKRIDKLRYNKEDLIELFQSYNKCYGEVTTKSKDFDNKAVLGVYAGLAYQNLDFDHETGYDYKYKPSASFNIGLHYSIYFKRSNNKLQFISALGLRRENFKAFAQRRQDAFENIKVSLDYIECDLGFKRSFFIKATKPYISLTLNNAFAIANTNKITTDYIIKQDHVVTHENEYMEEIRKLQHALKIGTGLSIRRIDYGLYFMYGDGFSSYPSTKTHVKTLGGIISYAF